MTSTHRTVRVFISSTFRDMHAELDHLVTVVFPELRERVEQVGLGFCDGANCDANVAKGIDFISSQNNRLTNCFGWICKIISGQNSIMASDTDPGAQIDLLIDRADNTISLCEMKFSEGQFTIDKPYAGELRQKRDTFRRVTGTRKNIFLTLVTTFGIVDNAYAKELVANSVLADELFS